MTKTRWTAVIVLLILMMTHRSAYADSGLVQVEVSVNDSTIYFDDKAFHNDELEFPFIQYNKVIYFPLACNTLKPIGLQLDVKEDVNEIALTKIERDKSVTLTQRDLKSSLIKKKAELKNAKILLDGSALNLGNHKILKYNKALYVPLTLDVLNQLGLYYSTDGVGDMHISSLSKKALEQSVNNANDAYQNKLIKFVRGVNRSLSEKEAERYVNAILKESRANKIDETWIFAMVWKESTFRSNCEYKGAVGIMQILVSTGKKFGLTKQDLLTPEKSIKVGVQYVKNGLNKFGSIEKGILAYNQGSGAVASGKYKTGYLDDIKEKREILLKKIR